MHKRSFQKVDINFFAFFRMLLTSVQKYFSKTLAVGPTSGHRLGPGH